MKAIITILITVTFSVLIGEVIPDWVYSIPNKVGIQLAVGVANSCVEIETARKKAFEIACYEMACQKKSIIKAKSLDIAGSDYVLYESVFPDSLDIKAYNDSAFEVASYSDSRYFYILIATDSIDITTELIDIKEDDLKNSENACYEEKMNVCSFGSSNYVSAIGFVYASNRAKVKICEQIKLSTSTLTDDSFCATSVNKTEINLVLEGVRITGYYVDYQTNTITAFAEYVY